MKEFRSIPQGKTWGQFPADKSVDEAIEAIVANAKNYKKLLETAEPQRQALFSTNYNKVP